MSPLLRISLSLLLFCGMSSAQLIGRFESADDTDTRVDRLPALWLQKGEVPTAFLPAGRFQVTWSGQLILEKRQRLFFSFDGSGKATLKIDGKEVLHEQGALGNARSSRVRLNPGAHDIEIRYHSADDGSAHFRLYWQELKGQRQSIPASAFSHQASADLDAAQLKRLGRQLFAELHCSKCHQSEKGLGSHPMPELQEIAPLLVQTGDRLQESWLRAWLQNPHELRPGTSMPQMFDPQDPSSPQKIADVAAFLSQMSSAKAKPAAASDETSILAGGAKFHQLGCVACHTLPDATKPDLSGKRIPLHHVSAKFQPGALANFLKNPSAYAPHRGMPDFQLNEQEVNELSAFLLARARAPLPAHSSVSGDAERGKTIASEHHCYACHAGMPTPEKITTPTLERIFQADWSQHGCVAPSPKSAIPHIVLTTAQRQALIAFRAGGASSLSHHDAAESAERKFHTLRCDACHARDQVPASLDAQHSESAAFTAHLPHADEKLDQSRPHMSFIGEMLQSDHIQQVIAGALPQKTRPWLEMRMPAYAAHAAAMSDGMARWHGVNPQEKSQLPAFKVDPALAKAGQELLSSEKGFGCTTCHGLRDIGPTAAFEVQGISLELIGSRLRHEWYHRWMDNPASITPGTKMPQYAPAGKSPNPAYQNDARQQFEAIWHFLQSQKNR
ncbi:MAG: hypothetical protein RLZZ224_32 [Verrucomicrobiota bacterium]